MKSDDNQFRPQNIDEQIERLIWSGQERELQHNRDAQLIQRLQYHYKNEKRKDTLQRAWESISQRYDEKMLSSVEEGHIQNEQSKLERSGQYSMQYDVHEQATSIISIRRKVLSPWGALASVAVLVLVIGSIALILSPPATQRNGAPGAGIHSICPPTPTVAPGQPTVTPTLQSGTTAVPCVLPKATPKPGATPTVAPVSGSTPTATAKPGAIPTVAPTPQPIPTVKPASKPTVAPTPQPIPTVKPASKPTVAPTPQPIPTVKPASKPTVAPD
jgi:hypothetical protein